MNHYFQDPTIFDTELLRGAYHKLSRGDKLSDDEITETLRFLQPMEMFGWAMDSRYTFFLTEIRHTCNKLREWQSARVADGSWNPTRDIKNPKFLQPKPPQLHGFEGLENNGKIGPN